jgi:hypothetical protein
MDPTESVGLFRNALLYTIAANTVRGIVNPDEIQPILYFLCCLFIVNSIIKKLVAALPKPCIVGPTNWQCGKCQTVVDGVQASVTCTRCGWSLAFQKRHSPTFGLILYLLGSVSNIVVQYESALVAQILLGSLNQTTAPRVWVATFAVTAAALLWLLTTSFA